MLTRIYILPFVSLALAWALCPSTAARAAGDNGQSSGSIRVIEDEVYEYDPGHKPRGRSGVAQSASSPAKIKSSGKRSASAARQGAKAIPVKTYANGERFNLEIRGAYWLAQLDNTMRVDTGELKGTELDLVDDLGLDRQKGVPSAEMTIKFYDRHKIRADYFRLSYSAAKVVEEDFIFNGVTYPARSHVNTSLDIQSARIGYEYDLYRGVGGYFAMRMSANFISAKADLVTNSTLSNRASLSFVAPRMGMAGRWNINRWLSWTADVSGVGYDKSYLFDGATYFDINPTRRVGFTVGWRSIVVNIEIDEKKADVQWNGVYGGVCLRL